MNEGFNVMRREKNVIKLKLYFLNEVASVTFIQV